MLTDYRNLFVIFICWLSPAFLLQANELDLDQQSSRYGELRGMPGHFSGADWNPAVDAWQGELHQLMQGMAAQLVSSGINADRLVSVMGPPDKRANADEMSAVLAQAESKVDPGSESGTSTEYWIYYWRGQRDYLYFSVREQNIKRADWFYSYE